MNRMIGKTVWVTAAGQGIGRATALALHAEGATVFGTDVDAEALASLAAEDVTTERVDGTDEQAVEAFCRDLPRLDGLVHCVGFVHHGSVVGADYASWKRSFELNVDSLYFAARSAIPLMRQSGQGTITAIASIASSVKGLPNRAAYGASKAAMIGLIKSIAADYVGDRIRANAVCPATIWTPSLEARIAELGRNVGGAEKALEMFVARQPLGRIGTAEEVAALCVHLSSDESAFTTGQAFVVDGGMTI